MTEIKRFEEIIEAVNKGEKVQDDSINYTLYWAYRYSKDAGNELIDFGETIWERDIEPIVTTLKNAGITEFTISSTFSGLIETLAEFAKHGVRMQGLTEIKCRYKEFGTDKQNMIPAIKMVLQ